MRGPTNGRTKRPSVEFSIPDPEHGSESSSRKESPLSAISVIPSRLTNMSERERLSRMSRESLLSETSWESANASSPRSLEPKFWERCEERLQHPPTPFSATLGSLIALGGLVWVEPCFQQLGVVDDTTLLFVGSFGALATLLYGAPAAPLGQVRNVIYGHITAVLVAFAVHFLSAHVLPLVMPLVLAAHGGGGGTDGGNSASAPYLPRNVEKVLTPSLAIGAMVGLGVTHPPATACVITYVMGDAHGSHPQGLIFIVFPALFGALWMLLVQYVLARCVYAYTAWRGEKAPELPRYIQEQAEAVSAATIRRSVRHWWRSYSRSLDRDPSGRSRREGSGAEADDANGASGATPGQSSSAIKQQLREQNPEALRRVLTEAAQGVTSSSGEEGSREGSLRGGTLFASPKSSREGSLRGGSIWGLDLNDEESSHLDTVDELRARYPTLSTEQLRVKAWQRAKAKLEQAAKVTKAEQAAEML